MTPFEEWATEYFGANVSIPEACRDAWNAAVLAEREACAKIPLGFGFSIGEVSCNEIADAIRARSGDA